MGRSQVVGDVPNTIECPSCGSEVDAAHRFCGACGGSLVLACSGCGTENPPGFRFCSSCGAALGGRAQAEPTEARRWVTVLFADLSGFTRISEQMDPEDVTTMIDRCMRRLGEVIEGFGGYVEKVVGDEVMALFGAPVAHEDDPERAVRAAIEMHACAVREAAQFGELQLRIGINTGEVMFAPVGPDSARHFTVMGDVVNTAARLESAAPLGRVLVGEETYRSASRSIRFEPVEPVRAKNKEEPVAAWLAVEVLDQPVVRPGSSSPLVGRESELALVRSVWERVTSDRRAHLVTFTGPPGIGKTRLTREVIDSLHPTPTAVLHGRCLAFGNAGAYAAFAQQVKQAAGIYETADAETAARLLREQVATVVPPADADQVAEHLSVLAGLGGSTAVDKPTLFFSARRFVEALGAAGPVVLVFEDIHWADAALLDLIESLAGRIRDAPVLFLCLARPELRDVRPQWGGGLPGFTGLPLEPLSDEDTTRLVSELAASHAETSADVDVERIASAAGGNPLFIEELVSSMAEGVTTSVDDLPTTIRGIIAARLDALPPVARDVLSDAAVVGKVFWRSVLDRLGGAAAHEGIELLEERDFIRREPRSRLQGDVEFTFRHVLTRDVAYGMIPRAARRERHGVVARVLEETLGSRAAEWASTLGHHHREAGDAARAATHLEVAAEVAGSAWAKDEAIRFCDEALELVADDDPSRQRIVLRKASLLIEQGDYPAVFETLEPFLAELHGAARVRALLLCARAAFWLADTKGSRRYADEAAVLAEQLGDSAAVGAALGVRVLISSAEGTLEEGLAISDKALPLLDEAAAAGDPDADIYRSMVLSHRGLQHYWLGDHEQAAEACRLGYEIGLDQHNVEAALTSGAQYGMCLSGLGRYEDAFSVFAEIIDHGNGVELVPRLTGRAVAMWAGALRELHDLDGARRLNEQAAEMGRRAAFVNSQVQSGIDLLLIDLAAGEIGTVETLLPSIAEQAEQLRGWHQWLVASRVADLRARWHLAAAAHDDAAEAATASIQRAVSVGRAKYEASGRAVLAQALAGLGRPADGVAQAEEAHRIAVAIDHAPTVWDTADVLSRLYERHGSDEDARRLAIVAAEAVSRCAGGLAPERRSSFLAAQRSAELLQRARS